MVDSQHEKVKKIHECCAKLEAELKKVLATLLEAVDNADRKVGVEASVKSCEEAMTKALGKPEQLYSVADEAIDPEAPKSDLESWLTDVNVENDEVSKKAREYIYGHPESEKTSQSSVKTNPKVTSPSKTSKTSTSRISKTSSQRQREFLMAKRRREAIARQNENMLRLAQQKQELDLQWLKQEREQMKKEQTLMLAELLEENRRLAEATLTELELN